MTPSTFAIILISLFCFLGSTFLNSSDLDLLSNVTKLFPLYENK